MLLPPSTSTCETRQVCVSENTIGSKDQRVAPGSRHGWWMVFAPPSDRRIRPVHVLWSNLYDCIHLDTKPWLILWILHLGSEHVILPHIYFLGVVPSSFSRLPILVSLRFSWQAWRWTRQLVVSLL
jgi:hypothetical protein